MMRMKKWRSRLKTSGNKKIQKKKLRLKMKMTMTMLASLMQMNWLKVAKRRKNKILMNFSVYFTVSKRKKSPHKRIPS